MIELTVAPAPTGSQTYQMPYGEALIENFIGTPEQRERGPQALRAVYPPHYVIRPHFHRTDQFQIFIKGHARYGKKYDLDPVSVHYTDAFSPYGPITVGEDSMTFFLLRAHADIGAYYMPGSRDKIEMKGKRHFTVQNRASLADGAAASRVETLIEPHADGLSVEEIVVEPRGVIPDRLAVGSGCFQLVLDGAVELNGATLGKESVVFAPAGEAFRSRRAGPAGAHLLELQFPVA
jgi:hypothetical protein